MTLDDFEKALPPHKASLHLTHNDHLSNYMTVQEDDESPIGGGDWVSEAERDKAYEANEMWQLQWYPETPVGFCIIKASSLEAIFVYLAAQ